MDPSTKKRVSCSAYMQNIPCKVEVDNILMSRAGTGNSGVAAIFNCHHVAHATRQRLKNDGGWHGGEEGGRDAAGHGT